MLLRAGLVALAAIAIAYYALGVRSLHLEADAVALATSFDLSSADAQRAERLLDRAGEYDPREENEIRKAELQIFSGQSERALERLDGVVEREPENVVAWILIVRAAEIAKEAEVAERARARVAELNPQAPGLQAR